jgi:hypothetical protein
MNHSIFYDSQDSIKVGKYQNYHFEENCLFAGSKLAGMHLD